MHNFTDDYQASISDPEYFFGKKGRSLLQWKKLFKKAYNCKVEGNSINIDWFLDGKLNVSGIYYKTKKIICMRRFL